MLNLKEGDLACLSDDLLTFRTGPQRRSFDVAQDSQTGGCPARKHEEALPWSTEIGGPFDLDRHRVRMPVAPLEAGRAIVYPEVAPECRVGRAVDIGIVRPVVLRLVGRWIVSIHRVKCNAPVGFGAPVGPGWGPTVASAAARDETIGMTTMRAAVFHDYGGPEVVVLEDRPVPTPGPGEVRLRVRAAALNHLDLWVRRGIGIDTTMPHIGGSDIAGEVEAVGPGVEPQVLGARVVVDPSLGYGFYDTPSRGPSFETPALRLLGEHTDGGFAEFVVVPAANLFELPDSVSFEAAAAASLAGVTAWRAVIGRGGCRSGESVLVTGGSGGVSTMAVQIAVRAGARVHVVTSGAASAARLRALGAHEVYDRAEGDWVSALRRATNGQGVDLAIDSVGEAMWVPVLRSLAVSGRVVCYGATTGPRVTTDLRHVFWKQLSILGSTMGSPSEYRSVMTQVCRGDLVAPIDRVLPLEETRQAHELLDSGRVFGKLVLTP